MKYINYEKDGAIGIVTIDRPSSLNALSSQVLIELGETFDNIDIREIRTVILTGAGEKSFVAGASINEMSSMTRKEAAAFARRGHDTFRKIEKFPLPVIAAVNGYALGGGCELALCCDIRICSENAVFGQPETGLGITPGFGGTQRLARVIGISGAKEMIYTARNINAEYALKLGLVNRIYPAEELMERAKKMASRIIRNAPIAVKYAKWAIDEGTQLSIDKALAVEERYFSECFETHDQIEGMGAFLEKRKEKNFTNS